MVIGGDGGEDDVDKDEEWAVPELADPVADGDRGVAGRRLELDVFPSDLVSAAGGLGETVLIELGTDDTGPGVDVAVA